jgi:hypothetical protein
MPNQAILTADAEAARMEREAERLRKVREYN